MDYQKQLMEIMEMRRKPKGRKVVSIKTEEEFIKNVFILIKSEVKNYVRAESKTPFAITIEIEEEKNRAYYALGKSEDDLWDWYAFLTGTSRVILRQEMLKEICEGINAVVEQNEELKGISAHISKGFRNLVISIN